MTTIKKRPYGGPIHFDEEVDIKVGNILTIPKEDLKKFTHPRWAPTWNLKEDHAFENIPPFKHIDRGFFGDPTFKSLLDEKTISFKELSPKLGLEVDGIQLSQLTDKQKDDLALLVEQKGVIAFKNQDFKHQSFEDIKNWGKYFGPLHVHPTSSSPLNQPEFHLLYTRGTIKEQKNYRDDRLSNIVFHSDSTYENQTPAITLFAMVQCPDTGADTQFIDQFEVYDRLSPLMKQKLEGLKVLHSSKEQAFSGSGGIQRKDPIESIHPLVRYHPVLKRKSLFVHNGFPTRILGLKTEESNNLLTFLQNHVSSCLDAHVRIRWDENTIVVWDNRRVVHTPTYDYDTLHIRVAFRLTTLGERPVETEEEYESWTPELEVENIKLSEYYANLSAAEYYEKIIKNA